MTEIKLSTVKKIFAISSTILMLVGLSFIYVVYINLLQYFNVFMTLFLIIIFGLGVFLFVQGVMSSVLAYNDVKLKEACLNVDEDLPIIDDETGIQINKGKDNVR